MLAPIDTDLSDSSLIGHLIELSIFAGTLCTSAIPEKESRNITNSSPPKRVNVSDFRRIAEIRSGACHHACRLTFAELGPATHHCGSPFRHERPSWRGDKILNRNLFLSGFAALLAGC